MGYANSVMFQTQDQIIPKSGAIFTTDSTTDSFSANTFPATAGSSSVSVFPHGLNISTEIQLLREQLIESTDPLPRTKYVKLFTLKNGAEVYASSTLSYDGQSNNYIKLFVKDNGTYYNFGWTGFGTIYFTAQNYPTETWFSVYNYDFESSEQTDIGFALSQKRNPYNYYEYVVDIRRISNSSAALPFIKNYIITSEDPYATDDNQTPTGGYGPYDYTSEIETPPQLPALSAAQVGFVSLWNPTQAEMQSLANYLWTGTFDLTNFKKLFTDPMECVLSVGIIPITPTREATKREIVFGGSSHSGVNAYAVTEQFYIVDMGTMHITGMSQGALDYSPYAKASIYLPYCGTYALDVDEIMDSDISLEYHIDIYTGACVAYLTIDGHLNSDGKNVNAIMYQFTGNVLASIPITGNDHSQFIQSMLFMGAAAAATVATSGAGAGAAAGAGADLGAETAATGFNKALAGSAINTVMSMKPNVLHSGNLSTTAGMLGGQKPFITMTWSNLCRPEDEYKLVGLPLHKSGTLSDFSGFTIVSACHLDNILCTDTELQMIEQALAKGVIL